MDIHEFIRRLPKAELHLHIEGAIPWDVVRARSTDSLPEVPESHADDYRFDDFTDFGTIMNLCMDVHLQNLDDYCSAAKTYLESLVPQNVRYAEISFGMGIARKRGMTPREVCLAMKSAQPEGMILRIYGGIGRKHVHTPDSEYMQQILNTPELDGFDLHSDERFGHIIEYAPIFHMMQERGFLTRAHAGELLGADAVRDTLDYLQVKRIEHGFSAIEDPQLVQRLIDEGITLDMCLTSNLKLKVVDEIENHPIRAFFDAGVSVTVSTDDPTCFGCTLTGELELLAEKLNFTAHELAQIQKNAFMVANMDEISRTKILQEIDSLLDLYDQAEK